MFSENEESREEYRRAGITVATCNTPRRGNFPAAVQVFQSSLRRSSVIRSSVQPGYCVSSYIVVRRSCSASSVVHLRSILDHSSFGDPPSPLYLPPLFYRFRVFNPAFNSSRILSQRFLYFTEIFSVFIA